MYIHLIDNPDDEWDEDRMDIIGQNGNDGDHYKKDDNDERPMDSNKSSHD